MEIPVLNIEIEFDVERYSRNIAFANDDFHKVDFCVCKLATNQNYEQLSMYRE